MGSLAELNGLFTAWVEQVYHRRVHTETGMAPLQRFLAGGAPAPTPAALLGEAFRWGQWRTVTKTATVSLHGNFYEVDPALAGARVELVFDPFDLSDIDVRHHARPAGKAVPFQIGRHVHPKARAEAPPPAAPTGIDYLRLVEDRHTHALGERPRYAQLRDPAEPPGSAEPAAAAAGRRPPPDGDGLPHDTDLLTLALTGVGATEAGDPAPAAELAAFAALPADSRDSTSDTAAAAAAAEPEETR